MTIEQDVFAALSPLCGGRVYPDTFPQSPQPDPRPSLRYIFVSGVPDVTVCGNGTDDETDYRIQIDGVANTGKERDALRLAIQAAMAAFPIPATCDSWAKDFDTETKGYRITLDYLLEPSTP